VLLVRHRPVRRRALISKLKSARLIIFLYISLQILCFFAITRYFFLQEKGLCLILELFHKTFCLKMWVEAHRWTNLSFFLPRSHIPCNPLGFGRAAVNETVFVFGCLDSIIVNARSSEIHTLWAQHFCIAMHLAETFTVVIGFMHRFDCHLNKLKANIDKVMNFLSKKGNVADLHLWESLSLCSYIQQLVFRDSHLFSYKMHR
jgi:hypothetical protein